jgi:hypothetical protein
MNGWAIVIASRRDRPNSRWRSGSIVRRLFEKPAPGLAGPSSAKPESSNGHFHGLLLWLFLIV